MQSSLNTIIQNAIEGIKTEFPSFKEFLDSCNALVPFVKGSSCIQPKLDSKLKHVGKTRPWKSVTNMLQSIQKNLSPNSLTRILSKNSVLVGDLR